MDLFPDRLRAEGHGTLTLLLLIATVLVFDAIFNRDGGVASPLWDLLGNYNYWLAVILPLLTCIAFLYFIINYLRRSEFNRLVRTTSKAKFVRNLDRIEFLAWRLGPSFLEIVDEKKESFGLKRGKRP